MGDEITKLAAVGQDGGRCHRVLLFLTRASDVIPSEPRSHWKFVSKEGHSK